MENFKNPDGIDEFDSFDELDELPELNEGEQQFNQDFETLEMSNLTIEKFKNGGYQFGNIKNSLKGSLGEYYAREHLKERYPAEFGDIIFKPEQDDNLPADLQYSGLQGLKPDAVVPHLSEVAHENGWYEAVVDSKAWCNFNVNQLDKVAEKYANLPILHPDGRVIFVIPDDLYDKAKLSIDRFTESSPNHKTIEVWKMGKTNADLDAEARGLYKRWTHT